MSFTQAFEQEIANLEELFKDRWERGLAVFEQDDALLTNLKDLKFKIEFECGMARKFLKALDYTNALVNFGLAERNYGVFFYEASKAWQERKNREDKTEGG